MSEQTIIPNSDYVKPCIKCGAMDRNKRGDCRVCVKNWREANKDSIRKYARDYRNANIERHVKNLKNWKAANPDKIRQQKRNWQKANPDKINVMKNNRRAKIKGNGGKLSPDIIKILLALQKGKCACCGKSLKQGYHLDHIMPIALGGTNTDDNVQLLTPSCNLRKSAKHPDDWARENGKLL